MKNRTLVFCLAVVPIGLGAGYFLAKRQAGPVESPAAAPVSAAAARPVKADAASPQSLPQSPGNVTAASAPVATPGEAALSDSGEPAARDPYEGRRRELASVFGANPAGNALIQMTSMVRDHGIGGGQAKALDDHTRFLLEHSSETLAELKAGLPKFPEDMALEHQYLVQFVKRLDVGVDEKLELLGSEMSRPMKAGSDGEKDANYFTPVAALEGAIQSTQDYGRLEPVLRGALAKQPKREAKEMMLLKYASVNEEGAKKIARDLGLY